MMVMDGSTWVVRVAEQLMIMTIRQDMLGRMGSEKWKAIESAVVFTTGKQTKSMGLCGWHIRLDVVD